MFRLLLQRGANLAPDECNKYSVHSFRIYLACALYACKCPDERIMAILRWKSKEALLIYARMNDCERTEWVQLAMQQSVDSTTAGNLPRLDPDAWVLQMQAGVRDGAFASAARDADRDAELGRDQLA